MTTAPIVLFAYNRPLHLRRTLDALKANTLAKQSALFIYADGLNPNATPEQASEVQAVRQLLDTLERDESHAFASIHITRQERNLGLADSIIQGVGEIMSRFGRAIILEDDILTSPVFLAYMNDALNRYERASKVWCIAAWSYPIETNGLGDSYFWRSPHCWGWASWADRWQHFRRDTQWALDNFTKEDIDYINLGGSARYFDQLIANHKGKIRTWAVYNYLIAYKHGALTLCPSTSYIKQIGFDGSGVHCGEEGEVLNSAEVNTKFPITYPSEIIESSLAYERIRQFELSLRKPFFTRAVRKVSQLFFSIMKMRKA